MSTASAGAASSVPPLSRNREAVDEGGRPLGEVGEGAFADLAALAEGLAQEDGGRRVAVGDGLDVHGHVL